MQIILGINRRYQIYVHFVNVTPFFGEERMIDDCF